MESLHIQSEFELELVIEKALFFLKEQTLENQASVLALSGTLGAGKTTFIKQLSKKLGVEDVVTSPTFVVMKQYDTATKEPFNSLVHIDAYRIEDIDEMRVLRFAEISERRQTLVCIEWAEKIKELLPPHTVYLNIEIDTKNENSRVCTFS